MKIRIVFFILLVTLLRIDVAVGLSSSQLIKISENSYAIMDLFHSKNFTVNAGAIITENSLIFIDAGMTISSAEFIWNEITSRVGVKEKVYLILTHYHSDHSFGMNFFKEKKAIIIEQKKTKELLKEYKHDYKDFIINIMNLTPEEGNKLLGDVRFPDPDLVVESDTVLKIDNENIHILNTPGHTEGGISIYYPKDKVLFTGDQMYEGSDLTTRFGENNDWKTWITELKRFEKLDLKMICPGHGKLCGYSEIKRNIAYLEGFINGFKSK